MGPNYTGYGYYGEQKKKFPVKLVVAIVVALIVIITLIGIIGAVLKSNGIGTQAQHLSARLTNLTTLTTAAAIQIHDGDLKKVNAETALITAGADADLATVLPTKVDKSIQAAEADTSATTTLSNAALDGTYDSAYKQVLIQQLQDVSALLVEMSAKTKSSSLQQSLNRDNTNFQALLTSLGKLTL